MDNEAGISGKLSPETGIARMLNRYSDLVLAGVIAAVISLIVLPLPTFLLDSLIAINLSVSVGLLMLALYVPTALGLSTFPSLLLFTTLFRLSLNIAATKKILLEADAGYIIDAFGKLVVGGNVIVGAVVFLIIAIVQFVVIAKGSERVAEVGARFSLDAMPGKQMSIDADLRAGLITSDDAKHRRAELERESQMHGAMDGAMKFVKGDAIASLIIAFINAFAGVAIGALMHDMSFTEAVDRYTILTVGEGMVSQIPSLFVSIAAGVVITRVPGADGISGHLGGEIGKQVLAQPMALLVTGTFLFGFVFIPGFPWLQFLVLGCVIGGIGYTLVRAGKRAPTFERTPMPAMKREANVAAIPNLIDEEAESSITVPLLIKLAPDMRDLLSPALLDAAFQRVRKGLQLELGVPFPGLRMRFSPELSTSTYSIEVQELPCERGYLKAGHGLLRTGAGDAQTPSTPVAREAAAFGPFSEPKWVLATNMPAQPAELPTYANEDVVAMHLDHVIRKRADSFVGLQETQNLIARAEPHFPELTAEVLRALPLQRITEVLRRLVQEGVSIRNLRDILESLITWGPKEKDVLMLTEYVRVDLGRFIVHRYVPNDDAIDAIMLDPKFEAMIRQSIQQSAAGSFLAMQPDQVQRAANQLRTFAARAAQGQILIVLTSMDIRRYVKRTLVEPYLAAMPVLSYQEVGTHRSLRPFGRVEL